MRVSLEGGKGKLETYIAGEEKVCCFTPVKFPLQNHLSVVSIFGAKNRQMTSY